FGPRRPYTIPRGTARSTPATARASPKFFTSPSVTIAASICLNPHVRVDHVRPGTGVTSRYPAPIANRVGRILMAEARSTLGSNDGSRNRRSRGRERDSESLARPVYERTCRQAGSRLPCTKDGVIHDVPGGEMARKVQFTDRELDRMRHPVEAGIGTRERGPAASPARLGYTSVLRILQVLEAKGYVRHEPEGPAYRYFPTVDPEVAGRRALGKIVDKIFHGSA